VVKLVALGAFEGVALGAVGGVVLSEVDVAGAVSVAPLAGQEAAVDAALKAVGLGFPAPGQVVGAGDRRAIWAGRGRAWVLGGVPGLDGLAAVTEQGDGIAALVLRGAGVEAVLARLVPMDLRLKVFPVGATARTFVNHMTAQVTRVADDAVEIMVMRSMARTLAHELREAALGVAARG
jgi:sarcosine oxidase subunit gamma